VQTLALTTDATGKVRHDAVVKQQHGTGTLVQSSHSDLLSKTFTEEQLMKPSEEEVAAKADETRGALEALLQGKTGGGKVDSQGVGSRNEQFIRYTPSNTNANMNSGAAQRIIR
jgi:SNW domain-containing protein 1